MTGTTSTPYSFVMALENFTINPGAEELIDANPKDANGNPTTVAPGSPINWVPENPTIITATPTDNTGLKAQVAVAAGAVPGVYQVDCNFQAVAFGPQLTTSFTVTVPQLPATTLDFVPDATQP